MLTRPIADRSLHAQQPPDGDTGHAEPNQRLASVTLRCQGMRKILRGQSYAGRTAFATLPGEPGAPPMCACNRASVQACQVPGGGLAGSPERPGRALMPAVGWPLSWSASGLARRALCIETRSREPSGREGSLLSARAWPLRWEAIRLTMSSDRPAPIDIEPKTPGPKTADDTPASVPTTVGSELTTPSRARAASAWKRAEAKAQAVEKTPPHEWVSFEVPTEEAIRFDFDAAKGKWAESRTKVKIATKPFAEGAMRECFKMVRKRPRDIAHCVPILSHCAGSSREHASLPTAYREQVPRAQCPRGSSFPCPSHA